MKEVDVLEYIALKVVLLGSAFARKINQYQIQIYQRRLQRFSIPVLNKAFEYAEDELDRLPSPRLMAEIAARFQALQRRYNRNLKVKVSDPETGMLVDAEKDPVTGDILYRITDCPEGRKFIETRKSLQKSERKSGSKKSNDWF